MKTDITEIVNGLVFVAFGVVASLILTGLGCDFATSILMSIPLGLIAAMAFFGTLTLLAQFLEWFTTREDQQGKSINNPNAKSDDA